MTATLLLGSLLDALGLERAPAPKDAAALPGGHAPFLDDPARCAEVIRPL